MRQRVYDRFAAALSVAILAVLAAVSYYLAELADRFERTEQVRSPQHEPDYFVERLALTRLNRQGEPKFRLSADRLLHYPDDDRSEFENPLIVSLEPDKPLVTLRAQRGHAMQGADRTHLYGDVVLTRAAQDRRPALLVQTDYVLLLSGENLARTDRPVTISYGASSLTGVGMEFNNETRVLNVLSNVRGIWAAPRDR